MQCYGMLVSAGLKDGGAAVVWPSIAIGIASVFCAESARGYNIQSRDPLPVPVAEVATELDRDALNKQASAVASALEAYQAGFRSLHWHEEVWFAPESGSDQPFLDVEVAFIAGGRWAMRGQHLTHFPDGTLSYTPFWFVAANSDVFATAATKGIVESGTYRGATRERASYPSLERLLGRVRRNAVEVGLPQMIRRAAESGDVWNVTQTSEDRLSIVFEYHEGDRLWFIHEVEIDWSRGGALTGLNRWRSLDGSHAQQLRIESFHEISGSFVPAIGWSRSYSTSSYSRQAVSKVRSTLETDPVSGFPDALDRQGRAEIRRRVREIAGDRPMTGPALDGIGEEIRVTRVRSINDPTSAHELLTVVLSSEAALIDGMHMQTDRPAVIPQYFRRTGIRSSSSDLRDGGK